MHFAAVFFKTEQPGSDILRLGVKQCQQSTNTHCLLVNIDFMATTNVRSFLSRSVTFGVSYCYDFAIHIKRLLREHFEQLRIEERW